MQDKPVIRYEKQVRRNAAGQLLPGSKLNPRGRPRGSGGGFHAVLQIVSDIATSEEFRRALMEQARKNPFAYARAVLVPLAPAKQRKALRAQIRAAEQAAFDKAQSPFFNGLKTQ